MTALELTIALIPTLPLLGFLINGLGFKTVPKVLVGPIGVGVVLASFALALSAFSQFSAGGNQPINVLLFEWFSVGDFSLRFSFLIDQLSLLMLMVVTGIGSLIHLYSIGYMSHDEGYGKFFAYLNLFMFSMLLLVMGSNYLIMFIGWEGVGLCSYLLIGFWNKNHDYNDAAKKAFIMNRIGDLGFLIGIFIMLGQFGSLEYVEVFDKLVTGNFAVGDATVTAITLCLFVGAMGKSAQVPLYTWLPDAMAGPTPVSALIHAATMVTAGIYMVVRSNVLFVLAPTTLEIVGYVGVITALMAATIGIFQNDIKKVLAYSTVSQLGYMFLALGVGAFTSGMFHVITHAFFKALLFLGAGSVIHAMSNEQDIRNMGGLRSNLKVTYLTFLIACIAISGIPPFAGFFSKDEILLHVFAHSKFLYVLAVLGSAMTAFYMFRLLFLTFNGSFRGTQYQKEHLHESPLVMTLPLIVLAVLSMVGGFMGLPPVFSSTNWLVSFMEPLFDNAKLANAAMFSHPHPSHTMELVLMGVSVTVALVSAFVAFSMYGKGKNVPADDKSYSGAVKVVYNKYYVDELYDSIFVKPMMALSSICYSFIDNKVLDAIVEGVGQITRGTSERLRMLQTGNTSYYLLAMVIGIIVVVAMNLM
ncbi:MAG: NADH-quinone oxidoreductase subunit L [Cytophagales bacterium]|nr:MAG: NADH-quinone oxidoreductase subunit L [Cytophagales bacterium]TAF59436.1 MAG: NADH-quinone oxidoreductase subunit L [Cytophagales bacterium]